MTDTLTTLILPIINNENGDATLLNYLDRIDKSILLPDDGLETIRIKRDGDGNVVFATTQKLPNLRFRLGDLLLETSGTGLSMAGSLDKPLGLVLTGIRFLKTLRKLSTIEVEKEDAEMLIAIYVLIQEEKRVHVGDLPALLPSNWSEAKIAVSLERLERLACIELKMNNIILNETILVRGAA